MPRALPANAVRHVEAVRSPEEWRPIPGYPDYDVSSRGRVRSWRCRGRRRAYPIVMRPGKADPRYGYRVCGLVNDEGRTSMGVHRAVCHAFYGPPPTPRHQAAHGNGRPGDNRVENLRWATVQSNSDDRLRHGTRARGESSGTAKLCAMDVWRMREMRADGEPIEELAQRFKVGVSTVRDVVAWRVWKHPCRGQEWADTRWRRGRVL